MTKKNFDLSKKMNDIYISLLLLDDNYKVQKNGVIRKRGEDGVYRTIGSTRHGYNIVRYRGAKLVVARIIAAKYIRKFASNEVVLRKNGDNLDDRLSNLRIVPAGVKGKFTKKAKRFSKRQKQYMTKLYVAGSSAAAISRIFQRQISRSHISHVIKMEL